MSNETRKATIKAGDKTFYIGMNLDLMERFDNHLGEGLMSIALAGQVSSAKVYKAAMAIGITTKTGQAIKDDDRKLIEEHVSYLQITNAVYEACIRGGFFTRDPKEKEAMLKPFQE